jgi:hypothetical protein
MRGLQGGSRLESIGAFAPIAGALIGLGVGAAAGAIYDITKHNQ